MAHPKCSRAKLDFLASDRHISRWRSRNQDSQLDQIAREQVWPREERTTLGVARAIYLTLPDGSPLWVEGADFKESRQASLRGLLS